MKRIFTIVLAAMIMSATFVAPVFAAGPTRLDFVKSLSDALELSPDASDTAGFTDLDASDVPAVSAAVAAGIVQGYGDGTFRPNVAVTCEQAAVMFINALGKRGEIMALSENDVTDALRESSQKISGWARPYLSWALINRHEIAMFFNSEELLTYEQSDQIIAMLKPAEAAFTERAVSINNGGYDIPAVVTMPIASQGDKFPVVIMLHGTGSNKDEAGSGYQILAPIMAENGIGSIRFDFIGNGESEADYIDYSFTTAVSDTNKAVEYAMSLENADANAIGVMGWSQGGTIALLAAGGNDKIKSVITWAGAPDLTGGLFTDEGYEIAKENGYSVLEFAWRDSLRLGLQWYEDVATTDVLEVFGKSTAPTLAITGSEDTVVDPKYSQDIADASSNKNSQVGIIEGADHTFNIFTGDMSKFTQLCEMTIEWFEKTLAGSDAEPAEAAYTAETVLIDGENYTIPAILTVPNGDGKFPVAILAHGHGGSKDEAGGFIMLSASLAEAGIASIRMDFPGCGDSEADFVTQNNIGNMLSDIQAAKAFIAEDARFDMSRLGLIGYSMGGRLSMLTSGSDDSFGAVVMWAPAGSPGSANMYTFMQCENEDDFNALYDIAKENGEVTYTAIFGFDQTLGMQWFDDMLGLDPVTAFAGFKGDLLTIYGDLDIIIPPDAAKAAAAAATSASSSILYEAKGADHGFGIYSNEPNLTQEIIDQTVEFLKEKL